MCHQIKWTSLDKGYELQLQSFHLEEYNSGVHHQYPCSLHPEAAKIQ